MRPRRVELDYLVPPRRPRWAGAALLVLSLVCAAVLLERYAGLQQQVSALEAERRFVAAPEAAPRAISRERLDEEARHAEAVVRELTLPWPLVMGAIEQAAMRDVALLELEPDAGRRLLKLSAEARSRSAMFRYLRRLSVSKSLGEVHLVRHEVRRDDPQRPVRFAVEADLR
jgi:hypothetical protein